MKVLSNACHTFRMERFQIPTKLFLLENRDLFGSPGHYLIEESIFNEELFILAPLFLTPDRLTLTGNTAQQSVV